MSLRIWDKKNRCFTQPILKKNEMKDFFLSSDGKLFIYKQNGNFTQLKDDKER